MVFEQGMSPTSTTRKGSAQVTRVCKAYAVDNKQEFVTQDSGHRKVFRNTYAFCRDKKKTVCYIHIWMSVLSGCP